MEKKSEKLREELTETKSAIAEKIAVLEYQLKGDFETAKGKVLDKFSLTRRLGQKPLIAVGGSVVAGFLVTHWWLGARRREREVVTVPGGPPAAPAPSVVGWAAQQFPDEISLVKKALFSFAISFVERSVSEYVAGKTRK